MEYIDHVDVCHIKSAFSMTGSDTWSACGHAQAGGHCTPKNHGNALILYYSYCYPLSLAILIKAFTIATATALPPFLPMFTI